MRTLFQGVRSLGVAGLLLLASMAAHAQWWNPDYTQRLPVTIANDLEVETPVPTTAEVTISPIPAALRADWTDLRVVHYNGSVWKDLDRQVILDEAPTGTPPTGGSLRVVFRLVDPIPSFGISEAYAIYYGALSPNRPASDIYKIYDHIVDFQDARNVVGQPAPDWVALGKTEAITEPTFNITVQEYQGKKQGFFQHLYHHPKAWVREGAMPTFLNAEYYARITPSHQGSGEMQVVGRVPASPVNTYPNPDRAYGGGYSFAVDVWDNNLLAHGTGIDTTKNPPAIAWTILANTNDGKHDHIANVPENILFRATDMLAGKAWKAGQAQPQWDLKDVALDAGVDPVYDQPGTVGVASYNQSFYLEFIAAREVRTVTSTNAVETGPSGQARIAGTVTSSRLGPLFDAPITISDGTNTWTVYTAADGRYQLTVPPGSYTVSASKEFHVPVNLTNVSPTVSGATNITLNYVGVKVSGTVVDRWYGTATANARVIAADSAGNFVEETTTNAEGAYTLMLPQTGTYSVGALARAGSNPTGAGDRKSVTISTGQEVTLDLQADVVANGDMELPEDVNESKPAGWGNDFEAPGAYTYTRDQNHTPGGKWSVAITDPANTSAWSPPNKYNLPVKADAFDVEVSVWVYFTKPGQYATLRMRNNWLNGGDVPRVAAVAGRVPGTPGYNAAADGSLNGDNATPKFELNNLNKGGLDNQGKVPVGQWYQLVTRRPASAGLTANELGLNLYGQKTYEVLPNGTPDTTKPVGGTIYFDDLKISIVPKYTVIARVVDQSGSPYRNAYFGSFTDGGTAGMPKTVLQSIVRPNRDGEVRFYSGTTAPLSLGAVAHMGGDANNLPDWGFLADRKEVTPVAYAPNLPPTATLTATRKAANVPHDGMDIQVYTFHMVDGIPTRVERNNRPIVDAFDNKFTTWSGNGGNQELGLDPLLPASENKKPRWNVIDINLWESATVDQFEFSYETAAPQAMKIWVTDQALDDQTWPMVNPPASDLVLDSTAFHTRGMDGYMEPYRATYNFLGGLYHWVRLPESKQGQYIRIWYDSYWPDGHTGFREIRILSKDAPLPPPFTMDDVLRVMKIAGGFEIGAQTDLDAFDAVDDNLIDMKDALNLARQVAAW